MPMPALGMRFVPRGLGVSQDAKGTHRIVFTKASPSSEHKSICTSGNKSFEQAMTQAVTILRADDPEFDAKNAVYQKLSAEYTDAVADIMARLSL
jgi:hypothetical protein